MTLSTFSALRRSLAMLGVAALSFSAGAAFAQQPPARVVASGGAITEIVYALGAQDRLVGVDTTSLQPPRAMKDKPNIGYMRQISTEGLLSLRPDLVLAVEGSGPAAALQAARDAGVKVEILPESHTPAAVVERIERIGALLDKKAEAQALGGAVAARFAALGDLPREIGKKKKVLFVLSLQNGRAMVGGAGASADAVLKLAGADNAAAAIEGYKPMSDEAILAAAPDVLLMMSRQGAHADPDEIFARPAFSNTPAARTKSLIAMDGLYLLGFGPRTPDAAHDLRVRLYPELAAQPWTAMKFDADGRLEPAPDAGRETSKDAPEKAAPK